ncbi:UTRA domain-containing protein [Pseudomonas gingeri NCPPB 3146 = LMG 5327]|uniref:UTRA domain-containing protein n=2 Tax=Pseudomonas gingeri TaxID=117681 RepID=A0A7Y8CCA8_9PSED|nr:UTRA domain-containing protein [Pseudomonas gingeri]NWA08776.1 UTRA domain-containing protein [Pseudomonas gingeri]NWC12716.1 UTRA domain-containing protein [Pseudomonas gingeri]NWE49479.1 UTRA domain-containing protein [Pseudomonas gingeri]NWE72983.1 UTRA domain-containing protein [Pseudomonas gingeri]PNQ92995.1 UTRA domain-containing protein [Pseudomonas gingeri NCPPB 3146 = LMG 5327]
MPLPLYQQVKAYVLDGIASGHFRSGEKIPSESELVAEMGASRLTVNRALRELSESGVLDRIQGVGTFVAPPKVASTFIKLHNIADDIRNRGQILTIRVHKLEQVKAKARIMAEIPLGQGAGAKDVFFHSLLVYCADGVPIQMEDRFVSARFAPLYLEQDFTRQSTTDYLQSIAMPTKSEHEIQATLPSGPESALLELTAPEAFLVLTRKTWVNEVMTSFTRFVHPGSRQRFVGTALLNGAQT